MPCDASGGAGATNGGGAGAVGGKEVRLLIIDRAHLCSSSQGLLVLQVTKDKMLAEKDEELRRMQEMLAQMQVNDSCWRPTDIQYSPIQVSQTTSIS